MMRPMTCLSLIAALGAGLYLYQVKHNAHLLDRDIDHAIKQADQARDRIGLLKAEWALLNEPERLQGLATEHLQLQPLQPTQFARLEDLPSKLPPVSMAPVSMAPVNAPVNDTPVASAAPSAPAPTLAAAPAAKPPVVMAAAAPAASVAATTMAPAAEEPALLPRHDAAKPVLLTATHPVPRPAPRLFAAARPRETEMAARPYEPEPRRPFLAPVMPAYAPTPVMIHAPTVQTASAMQQPSQAPFVGSALGMARSSLAAPVPVGNATSLGYASGR